MKENFIVVFIIGVIGVFVVFGIHYGKKFSYQLFYEDMVKETISEEMVRRFIENHNKVMNLQPSCADFAKAHKKRCEASK